ncbi:MAG: glycoside hydrolase family 15 protein [Gemmatimonas sp.]
MPHSAARRIEDYALIGNARSAALVAADGAIEWFCAPRFDSEACFAAMLGDAENGRWSIAPREPVRRVRRRYLPDTLVLETVFECDGGSAALIDFMPHPDDGACEIIRIVRGIAGSVRMGFDATFRFDYGHVVPWVRRRDGVLTAIAGPNGLALRTPIPIAGKGKSTSAEFTVREGESHGSVLAWFPSHLPPPPPVDAEDRLAKAMSWWRDWTARCEVTGEWRDAVVRSAITLKALTHRETGGLVAAATTSLPERVGGPRNWDYRYCWLRDATFTLYALLVTGYTEEAAAWRQWLIRAVAGEPSKLQIMYGLRGERRLEEFEIPWLAGFADSRPVRIGNAAHAQRQLDVYGEVMDMLHSAREHGLDRDDDAWRIQRELLAFLESTWSEPDSGLWEERGPERCFTFSRMMAWVAFDRGVKSVERFGLSGPADTWRAIRDRIHGEICSRGYDSARNTFVQFYGGRPLDASLLLAPQIGFLSIDDRRVVGTVDAVQRELMRDGFVLRYSTDDSPDGLPPGEGAFLACSFWLADDLTLLGRCDEARALFERALSVRNDVGLLAEEYDPVAKRMLGNFPQAFSHVGVINTARNLSRAAGPAQMRGGQAAAGDKAAGDKAGG